MIEKNHSDDIATETRCIPAEHAGQRLDKVLSLLFPDYSRARLQAWLKDGHITVDGNILPAKHKVDGGESLHARFPAQTELGEVKPEFIPLDIQYEDDHILIINKPVGLVMHPAAGNASGTLQNGLLHYLPELTGIPRAGIVHRLDKLTSGLLVVAKTLSAHKSLVAQLQARTVKRTYDAVCFGHVIAGGKVETNIGRHVTDRKRMAVRPVGGKEAITHYRVLQKFRYHTHIRCQLETGRTHQIRVHMAHLKKPLVGDAMYGGRLRLPGGITDELDTTLRQFQRQALNASELGLIHPETNEWVHFVIELPSDMQQLLHDLKQDTLTHAPTQYQQTPHADSLFEAHDLPHSDEDDWGDIVDDDDFDDDWNEDDYDVDVEYTNE